MLELRRGKCPLVQKEMVEFIVFLFPFSREQTIWPFMCSDDKEICKKAQCMCRVVSLLTTL